VPQGPISLAQNMGIELHTKMETVRSMKNSSITPMHVDKHTCNCDLYNKSILIVDDDVDLLNELYELLSFYKMRAVGVISVDQAIEVVRTISVDVVLTDFNMPVLNGLELARAIELLQPTTKIIIMSGIFIDTEAWSHSWQFLQKPFQMDALMPLL